MPVKINIDPKQNFVYAKAKGLLTAEEIVEYDKAVESDDQVKSGFKELFDVTDIDVSELTEEKLDYVIEMIRSNTKRISNSRLAIVVSQSESYMRANYFEKHSDDKLTVIVFNSIDTARVWLGVKEIQI